MMIESIAIVHSSFVTREECPIQPLYASGAIGRVEVFEEYEAGRKDIVTFSHIYLIYHFDRAGEIELIRSTFVDDESHGVFATRHPCRPNGYRNFNCEANQKR